MDEYFKDLIIGEKIGIITRIIFKIFSWVSDKFKIYRFSLLYK